MALMTRELKASFAFVERNFNLTKRYWGWEVGEGEEDYIS